MAKTQKYIDALNQAEGTATMMIHGAIGEGPNEVNGFTFANEVNFLKQMGIKDIKVKINTPGGSVVHGFSIFSALNDPELTVHTLNDGVSASMGSHLLMLGNGNRVARDYSRAMVHDVQGGDDEIRSQFRDSLKTMYLAKTNLTPEEVDGIFQSGKDIWMNADQQLEKGFVDEIMVTEGKRPKMAEENNAEELFKIASKFISGDEEPKNGAGLGSIVEAMIKALIFKQGDQTSRESVINQIAVISETDESTVETYISGGVVCPPRSAIEAMAQVLQVDVNILLSASNMDGCAFNLKEAEEEEEEEENEENPIIFNTNKKSKMEDLKNYFGKKQKTVESESDVIAQFTALETTNSELEKQVETLENELDEARTNQATTLVENAISEGKIEGKSKDKWVNMAKANFDLAKETIEGIATPAQKITDQIDREIKNKGREDWTIRQWEKQDPKGLQKMKDNNPEVYNQMYSEYYGKK